MADKEDKKRTPEEERKKRLQCYASRGPGPASVNLPPTIGMLNHDKMRTRTQRPAYSLSSRWKTLKGGVTPGPEYPIAMGLTARGPYMAPAYTIRPKTKIHGDINRTRMPAYTLRKRTKIFGGSATSPGPIYLLPSALGPKIPYKPAAAECSLKGRGKDRKNINGNAGFYDIGPPDMVKNKKDDANLGIRHTECAETMTTATVTDVIDSKLRKIQVFLDACETVQGR